MSNDLIIVCVDTVAKAVNDYEDLENVFESIKSFPGIVLVRSTVAPAKAKSWEDQYNLKLVMFPEFLKQSLAGLDLAEPSMVVLGGTPENTSIIKTFLINSGYCPDESKYHECTSDEASLIKLAENAFLSTKVTFFNSIYDICIREGYSYESVRKGIILDSRIGPSHTLVPGPEDGKLGFGGHCLPKDLAVISKIDNTKLFSAIIDINNTLRGNR